MLTIRAFLLCTCIGWCAEPRLSARPRSIAAGESTTLEWRVPSASSAVLIGIGPADATGSIRVSPQRTTIFTLVAETPSGLLTDTVLVEVGGAPLDNIEVVLRASRAWPVQVGLSGDKAEFHPEAARVTLEPRSELNPTAAAEPGHDGKPRAFVAPDENYDVAVTNIPADYYLKSIKVGNEELLGSAVSGSAAAEHTPLQLTLAANGGRAVSGALTPATAGP